MKLTKMQVREIADNLDMGMKSYIHKDTGRILAVMGDDHEYNDPSIWEETLEEIEQEIDKFIVVEPMSSREAFEIMEGFVEEVSDHKLKDRLTYALNGREPFRTFKHEVNYDTEVRDAWFAYRQKVLEAHVREILKEEFEF